MDEPIPITDDNFNMAMDQIRSANTMLSMFDWAGLCRGADFAHGAGAVLDPGAFMAIDRDPQWNAKVKVWEATRDYVAALKSVREVIENDG